MTMKNRARAIAGALLSVLLAVPSARAQAQNAVITGKVTSEFGQPIDAANVYINDLAISVATNAQGAYTITIPAARVTGQQVNLRVRAIGWQPGLRPITVRAGSQEQNFALKQDINRLNEVVVTGTIESTERSKVPFAVSHLSAEDIPVPALDPIRALEGKMPGVRVAQTSGRPGSTPEILMRGPTSLNVTGRSQGPLIIVDGAIMNVGSLEELGGLDIESVEVVKGAAGASLYGTKAANGVITIKTKRGASQDGVKITARTEYGISQPNSFNFGLSQNHDYQLDETGTRFCVAGTANVAPCSRTLDWNTELLRQHNVNADTIRSSQPIQFAAPSLGDGSLLNVYQANPWPGKTYNPFAQFASLNPTAINSIDGTGRMGAVSFYVSGAFTDEAGAFKAQDGVQQRRGRVNIDYTARSNLLISVSTVYDRLRNDLHDVSFGTLARATPGTNYLLRDTLPAHNAIIRGNAVRLNGTGGYLYNFENEALYRESQRFIGNVTTTFFPTDWVTFEGVMAYDNRSRIDYDYWKKGYRTTSISTSTNFGGMSLGNREEEAYNGSLTATLRKQITNDLSGKLQFRGLYDQDYSIQNNSGGQQFIVKDVNTLSNISTNKTATSVNQLDKNMGFFSGASADYKGKYILDGTFRYDGSSRFGAGERWAPFGRISGVWRVSEEPYWHVPHISDFRLRASRGSAGTTPSFNAQYETYNCSTSGCSLGQAGNAKLKPEVTTETEIGSDFTLFDRLGIELTHASGSTRNQLLNVPTPSSLGFTRQWQNAGTLANYTWEAAANLPLISKRDFTWSMRSTWDRTRTYITQLLIPEYFDGGGTGQGTGTFFLITDRKDVVDGRQVNQYGNIWGRRFYRSCGELPSAVQGQCGDGKAFQVNDDGWVVWVGDGNSWKDGITKNLWQTKLPAAQSPWNVPLYFGHAIIDRPLKGEKGEGIGNNHILGNTLPSFRATWSNNIQYKRLTAYALVDGTFGHSINNQTSEWGLLDFSSNYFDMGSRSVENAKPLGYSWRVGAPEGVGSGGFYDQLGPNTHNVEGGSYAKMREMSLTYRVGKVHGLAGEWTAGFIGRNLLTFTHYSGYDPEAGVSGGNAGSGLINQTDAFDYPTLRTFTLTLSTRF
jgi:TonB-linked SusC/RagA family outer membrane protein